MIKNESLSDRLNEFKFKTNNGQSSPEEIKEQIENITSIKNNITNSIITLLIIFIRSFTFGYGLMTLLNLNWKFLSYFCVGMSINFIIEFFLDLVAVLRS
jgi:hypothetical protein